MNWYKFNIKNLTDTEYQKWYSLMNNDRRNKVDSFKNIDDKKRTIVGEMLVKKAISDVLNIKEDVIDICENKNQKPYVKDLDINFNISHSDEIVVCVVDKNSVGIDIEKIRPINLKIAKKICNEEELLYLFSYSPTDSDFKYTEDIDILNRFFEIWTGKEAYIKCFGVGLKNIKNSPFSETDYFKIIDGYAISIKISK